MHTTYMFTREYGEGRGGGPGICMLEVERITAFHVFSFQHGRTCCYLRYVTSLDRAGVPKEGKGKSRAGQL